MWFNVYFSVIESSFSGKSSQKFDYSPSGPTKLESIRIRYDGRQSRDLGAYRCLVWVNHIVLRWRQSKCHWKVWVHHYSSIPIESARTIEQSFDQLTQFQRSVRLDLANVHNGHSNETVECQNNIRLERCWELRRCLCCQGFLLPFEFLLPTLIERWYPGLLTVVLVNNTEFFFDEFEYPVVFLC